MEHKLLTLETTKGVKIRCEKDSFTLLKKTVLDEWNDSLHRIKSSPFLQIQKNTDGTNRKEHPYIIEFCSEAPSQTSQSLMCFKVDHLLMASDIAFYAMGLDKVNMSGAWCWLCRFNWIFDINLSTSTKAYAKLSRDQTVACALQPKKDWPKGIAKCGAHHDGV